MNLQLSFTGFKKSLTAFLRRFHITLFVLVVFGGLAATVFMLNSVIMRSSNSGDYIPDTPSASFDETTIDRIEELQTRDQTSSSLQLPAGRGNPFVE